MILYAYQDAAEEEKMRDKRVIRLCKEFGFMRQAEICPPNSPQGGNLRSE
jgi:hypothetical protein